MKSQTDHPRIYLDNNATTLIDPQVVEAVLAELKSTPHNPSSIHSFGREAKKRLEESRTSIASYLKVPAQNILFTSGGTESMNTLIYGFLQEKKGHVITSDVEHACIYQPLKALQEQGWEVSFLPAGLLGAVSAEQVEAAIRPDTQFILLTAVNNETGVKHDLAAIGQIAHKAQIPFLVDGVAWLGKEPLVIPEGVTAIGFSGHKIHGPQGVGFISLHGRKQPRPLLLGGGQEQMRRGGTENLPGIVGLAKATQLLREELPAGTQRMALLRDKLEAGLLSQAAPAVVNGMGPRICNTCNLSFPHTRGEDLLIALDMTGIAVSHGAACSSGALEPSRVLLNMGLPTQIAGSAIRFSLSRMTTEEEIDRAIGVVSRVVQQMRQ